jgi:UDP-N-acetylmuramoyl-tripeptide--D-alanyl-D-alanine ligase
MATPIPDNTAAFTTAEIQAATGAVAVNASAQDFSVSGVATDTRANLKGKLFVALKGETFDAHRFVAQAVAAGAAAVMVEQDVEATGVPLFKVPSCLDALGQLAQAHRRHWGGTVVAVGGSAGKTTTRCAITALLNAVLPGVVHSSVGNLNNRVGVPMVLFGLQAQHRVAVIEVGTNQRGEVPILAQVTAPNIALLTLVDLEHSEGLGGLDEIEAEEGALLAHASEIAIANGDDARAVRQLANCKVQQIRYGSSANCEYRILERQLLSLKRSAVSFRSAQRSDATTFSTSLLGMPGAMAALAAVCVADAITHAAVAPQVITNALENQGVGEVGRLRPVELKDATLLLDDSYNANPASMRASIDVAREIARLRGTRLLLVLGEMLELGAWSAAEHASMGAEAAKSGAAGLIAVGGDSSKMFEVATKAGMPGQFVATADLATVELERWVRPGDVVLFKASRGIGLEKVVSALAHKKGRAA